MIRNEAEGPSPFLFWNNRNYRTNYAILSFGKNADKYTDLEKET